MLHNTCTAQMHNLHAYVCCASDIACIFRKENESITHMQLCLACLSGSEHNHCHHHHHCRVPCLHLASLSWKSAYAAKIILSTACQCGATQNTPTQRTSEQAHMYLHTTVSMYFMDLCVVDSALHAY
eukprot:scpid66155/ scgid11963/ 